MRASHIRLRFHAPTLAVESMPCGLVRIDKMILVGCMASVVHAYHLKGKKAYSLYLPAPLLCMELLSLTKTRNVKVMRR